MASTGQTKALVVALVCFVLLSITNLDLKRTPALIIVDQSYDMYPESTPPAEKTDASGPGHSPGPGLGRSLSTPPDTPNSPLAELADREWSLHLKLRANTSNYNKVVEARDYKSPLVSMWSLYQPAWSCAAVERIGHLSEGGKWVCGLPALAAAAAADVDSEPCHIYSFGVSGDTSFEAALMGRLEQMAPGRCRLHMFDPSVVKLPKMQPPWIINGSHSFEQLALSHTTQYLTRDVTKGAAPFSVNAARARAAEGRGVTWNQTTLRHLVNRDGLKKANILKVDIENAEFLVFLKNACLDPDGLPFDQLLIELHYGPPGFTPEKGPRQFPKESGKDIIDIFDCLEGQGFVIFSREPNANPCACKHRPLWTYEYSFVRRDSIFATPVLPKNAPVPTSGSTSLWSQILAWQETLYLDAVTKRTEMVTNFHNDVAPALRLNDSSPWSAVPSWQCKRSGRTWVYYIWDLFEPRFPCPSRRFGEGGNLRCLHGDSVEYRRIELLSEPAWAEAINACSKHDPSLVALDELVVNARILGSGEAGSGRHLANLVGCLEEHGFRIYGNDVDSIRCQAGEDRLARFPDTALLGFVRKDSPSLKALGEQHLSPRSA